MTEQIWKRYLPDQKVMQALAFEAGKFIPFQRTDGLGPTNGTTVYSVTGAGMLDLAIASGGGTGASIRIIVDGETLVQSPNTTSYAVGVLPIGEWTVPPNSIAATLLRGGGTAHVSTPLGTYVPGITTSSMGVLWIARPIKFNKSLQIIVGAPNGGDYRIQGGLFI